MKLTVNLASKMISGRKKLSKDAELAVAEANNLLAAIDEADRETLAALGLDSNIRKADRTRSVEDGLAGFDMSRVFHIDEIKKICCQYDLRFLPTTAYRGTVDPLLPSKIRAYEEKYAASKPLGHWTVISKEMYEAKGGLTAHQIQRGHKAHYKEVDGRYYMLVQKTDITYYIAAPASSFELQQKPKDPLCFAPIGVDGYYYLVHQWGNDLSIFRRLRGLFPIHEFFTDVWSGIGFLCMGVFATLISALFLVLMGNIAVRIGYWNQAEFNNYPTLVPLVIVTAVIWGTAIKLIGNGFQNSSWNSPFED